MIWTADSRHNGDVLDVKNLDRGITATFVYDEQISAFVWEAYCEATNCEHCGTVPVADYDDMPHQARVDLAIDTIDALEWI